MQGLKELIALTLQAPFNVLIAIACLVHSGTIILTTTYISIKKHLSPYLFALILLRNCGVKPRYDAIMYCGTRCINSGKF